MKLIKPTYRVLLQDKGINGIYKAIERAGRLAYKSEDKITEGSAKLFVDKLINAGHLSCLEHGTVYLRMPITDWVDFYESKLSDSSYLKINYSTDQGWDALVYVTTNYRTLVECGVDNNLERYLCLETPHHEKRISVHFTSSIGIMRELFRHRRMSYIQESTRYCNYSKDKFGNEVSFIIPGWSTLEAEHYESPYSNKKAFQLCASSIKSPRDRSFYQTLGWLETQYLEMIDDGMSPQEAREVLPLCTKAEAIVTGFESDWKHIFKMRTSKATAGKPHPDMIALMDPLLDDFHRLFNTVIE